MAKVRIHVTVEENLAKELEVLASRMRWSFTAATEEAIKNLVQLYRGVELPTVASGPEPTPEVEKA